MFLIRIAMAVMLAACLVTGASAAEKAKPAAALKVPAQAEATYDDPLGRSTPQGTVLRFLRAMQREDYERAVDFLDTRQTGKRAELLAIELHHVLDEGLSTVTTTLSSNPEGTLQDNLPDNRELVGTVRTKRGNTDPARERPEENNPGLALFLGDPEARTPDLR
jgi:MscS family membrane protein